MPYCPQCLAEYRDGFTRCATCDVDLVEQLGEEMVLTEENIRRALEGKELLGVARGESSRRPGPCFRGRASPR